MSEEAVHIQISWALLGSYAISVGHDIVKLLHLLLQTAYSVAIPYLMD